MFYWVILFTVFLFFVRDIVPFIGIFCIFLAMILLSRGRLPRRENFPYELIKIGIAFLLSLFLFYSYSPHTLINKISSDELSGFCVYVDHSGFDLYADYKGRFLKFRVLKKGVDPSFEHKWVSVSGCSDKKLLPANRGGFDYDGYLKAHLYAGYLYPKLIEASDSLPITQIQLFLKLKLTLARFRSDLLRRTNFLSDDSKILVRALLFGEIGKSWLGDFSKKLGVIHIFVISGMHFHLIAGGFQKICLFLSRGRFHLTQLLYVAFCTLFLCLNDFSIGATRAFVMILLQILCFYTKRVYDSKRFLILIAGVWGILNPNALMQPAFHLSFVASYFVIEISGYQWLKHLRSKFFKSFLTSSSVSVLMFSIIYVHYLEIHLISILLIPFITLMVVVFMLFAILYLGLDFLFDLKLGILALNQMRVLCMNGMDQLSDLLKAFMSLNARISEYSVEMLYAISIFLSAFTICFFLFKSFRRDLLAKAELFLLCVIIASFFACSYLDFGFSIRSFALRDGESYLIRWNRSNVVYDVGNDKEIVKCLKRCGVRTIDLLVISHFDQDHCGMLSEVLNAFRVKYALYPPENKVHIIDAKVEEVSEDFPESEVLGTDAMSEFTLHQARIRYSSLIFSNKNHSKNLNKNESSIIMSIEYENKSILLNGDIEKEGMAFQNKEFTQEIRSADIIKIPHHGSYREGLYAFLELSNPRCYLIGGGRGKRIKKQKTLEALEKTGLPYYDTNESGEILINYHVGRWKTVEYKNEL